jgi:hypothetical protein
MGASSPVAIGLLSAALTLTTGGLPASAATLAPPTPVTTPVTVPAHADTTVLDVSLSAGRVSYLDGVPSPLPTGGNLWQRTVTRTGTALAVGPESHLAGGATADFYTTYSATSFSAGRGAADFFLPRFVVQAGGGTKLIDRGAETHEVPVGLGNVHRLRVSGPYVVADGVVLRADGYPVFELPAGITSVDLFGASLVYSLADGSVLLRDLTGPAPAPPVTLASPVPGTTTQVAVRDHTVAWTRRNAITIRTLPGTATRTVTASDDVTDLRLSEGALSWSSGSAGDLWLVDLKRADSRPVVMPGLAAAEVDDHLVAGVDSATGLVSVRPLPFGQATKYRPPRTARSGTSRGTAGTRTATQSRPAPIAGGSVPTPRTARAASPPRPAP